MNAPNNKPQPKSFKVYDPEGVCVAACSDPGDALALTRHYGVGVAVQFRGHAVFHRGTGEVVGCFLLHGAPVVFPSHLDDADCTVDPETDCCTVCGVVHGDPCADCGARALHLSDCPTGGSRHHASDLPWPTHPDGRPKNMGEMSREEARTQARTAIRRLAAREGWTVC